MKKLTSIIAMIATLCIGCMCFTACSSNKYVIGVIQFGSHESLNNCYDGFYQGLIDGGVDMDKYTVELQNSNFDSSTSATQATSFVDRGVGLIMGIATPSAAAAVSASNGAIPVVYCAVSDPESAGFTSDSVSNVTGSSDVLNFDAQLQMIRAFLPDATTIGVMYTITESNSLSQIETLKALAPTYGFEIISKSINASNELESVSDLLLAEDIDCVTNLTDNTVVGYLENFLVKANEKGIPVFGSEIEQVELGCLGSESLDYVELGRQTGLIAAQIILGEKTADEIDYLKIEDSFPCYNSETLASFGLTLPDGYTDILDVVATDDVEAAA
jgi:putative ABC transport system substrate-binding protein